MYGSYGNQSNYGNQGNGQAQVTHFPRSAALAQPAPTGYPAVERKIPGATSCLSPTSLCRASQKSLNFMTADALPCRTALLLVPTEAHASVDKRALRHAGCGTVRVLTSGVQAARLLAGLPLESGKDDATDRPGEGSPEALPDVILCHATLADMSGADFVALVRCHPQLLDLPIITLASNDDEAQKISALASGYSALLVRPYAPAQLRTVLLEAAHSASDAASIGTARRNTQQGDFDRALAQYTLLGHGQEAPEKSFQDGMRHLQGRQWDLAIRAFQKAMRQITLKGESELGLATAWKGKGDLERYRHYLSEASHTFARALQWHKARTVYARLLQTDPQAQSPFLAMAERLIRECRFEEASTALAAGFDLSPSDSENATARALARACLHTDTPDYAARRVEEGLRQSSLEALAPQLGQQIRANIADEEQRIQERQRRMAAAPKADELELPLPQFSSARNSRTAAPSRPPRKGIALSHKADAPFDVDAPSRTPVLLPLNPEDAESKLFYNMPGLNEALSVAKFTWKLFHASRRRK